jgi:hypothetical protein
MDRAALAAEPASGEAEFSIMAAGKGRSMTAEQVGKFNSKMATYLAAIDAPPTPPTQGEAKPARSWPVPFEYVAVENSGSGFPSPTQGGPNLLIFTHEQFDAALRQRVDEATRAENEACAVEVMASGWRTHRSRSAIAAAIRARIAP